MRPDELLQRLCGAPRWEISREGEEHLGTLRDALAAGWTPALEALTSVEKQRAGYLLSLLAEGVPTGREACAWVARLHASIAPEAGTARHDELARHWGLDEGLDVLRVRRALRLARAVAPPVRP